MCGLVDDAFNFVKDSAGEIFSHPGQAAGALFGIPGYDPAIGGLFNNGSNGAIISPTGNFTSGAWNDMYNANPNDSGALNLFGSVNSVADKIAPAAAGYFAAPALAGSLGGSAADGADLGAGTFSAGLGASAAPETLGGLESGMGGAGMFGIDAGTGTAIGSGVAQGMGAGGLGIAGGSSLGGLGSTGGTYLSGLGGSTTSGTGLGSMSNTAASMPSSPVDMGGGGTSMEGAQASMPAGASNPMAAGAVGPSAGSQAPMGGDLSSLFGPTSTSAYSPMGSAVGDSTGGITNGVTPFGASLGQGGVGSGLATDVPGQSIGDNYSAAANSSDQGGGGGFMNGLNSFLNAAGGNNGTTGGIQNLFKLGQQGLSAYQQYQKGQAASNYAKSIRDIYSPTGAYAQQMKDTIGRQYAAQGRRGETSPQAVQLAAQLASSQAQAMGGSNYANAAQNTSGANALNGLFGIADTEAGKNLIGAGYQGLSNLFGA